MVEGCLATAQYDDDGWSSIGAAPDRHPFRLAGR
ncbi:hypothetical protein IWX62_001577 [Arthrobacter sp. CAN_A1]